MVEWSTVEASRLTRVSTGTKDVKQVNYNNLDGKPRIWNVTLVITLANSYSSATTAIPGGVDEFAPERKTSKITCSSNSYDFQPVRSSRRSVP